MGCSSPPPPRPLVDFGILFQQHWPDPPQCEVTAGAGHRCPNPAVYVLSHPGGRTGRVCDHCLPSRVHEMTGRRRTVVVERLA